jgi:hypothetical protein
MGSREQSKVMGKCKYCGKPVIPWEGYFCHNSCWQEHLLSEMIEEARGYGFSEDELYEMTLEPEWLDE